MVLDCSRHMFVRPVIQMDRLGNRVARGVPGGG
jgi:hypothetical protein